MHSSENSDYFKVGSDFLNVEEIRRRFNEWTEEDEKKLNPQNFVVYPRSSSWHCIFCGEEMWEEERSLSEIEFLHCRKCDVTFNIHYPNDEHRRAGESFSVTYWH